MQFKPRSAERSGPLTLTVCVNVRDETVVKCCGRHGGIEIAAALREAVLARSLPVEVQTIQCLGMCARGPNARLSPSNSWFHAIELDDIPAVVEALASFQERTT